jgi:energy-coupling factor transporter ATP-binding protein EcfA2
VTNNGQALPDATGVVAPVPDAPTVAAPVAAAAPPPPPPPPQAGLVVPATGGAVGASIGLASATVQPAVRIARITISDFRGFPPGDPYRFQLEKGKNLLLHGENGAGKTSVFQALRLLLSPLKPTKSFADYQHVFANRDAGTPGVVAIDLTAGTPSDYRWDAGNLHPSQDERDVSFREYARRAIFLDYKALLRTNFLHEDKDHINLFDLLVGRLLRDVEFPDGRTVAASWHDVKYYFGSQRRRRRNRDARRKHIDELAEAFRDQLNDLLNAEKVGVVAKANQLLEKLSRALSPLPSRHSSAGDVLAISLEVGHPTLSTVDMRRTRPPHEFAGEDVTLRAAFGGKPIEHPAIFFNEARLTAIALALYLATALVTIPKARTSNLSRLLVLDDALIGLDLAHRLPLLDVLNADDFKDWQILLLTYDANWFEMASDYLPGAQWAKYHLLAMAHEAGWEIPVLQPDSSYLDRAWQHIQAGDFKAAAVYLRTAWEVAMREFCEARQLKVPLKREMHEYKAEDFWPLVKGYEFKPNHRLVGELLAGEIDICRQYVLNPLCHNDPARPTREEVRRAHSAVTRLKTLLVQNVNWLKQLDGELRSAAVHILGDNRKLREKALKGLAWPNNFALLSACRLLADPGSPVSEIAALLRSAFDRALWDFCSRKGFTFTLTCMDVLTTDKLWLEATQGGGGLAASRAAFVAGIQSHKDLMLEEAPPYGVLSGKTQAQLEQIRDLLCGGAPTAKPQCILDSW